MNVTQKLAHLDLELTEFWTYWNTLPKTGLIPHLRDYLDSVPPKLQPSVTIVDVFSPDRFALRLAGTEIVNVIGREPTSADAPSVYDDNLRQKAARLAWAAVNHPCGYAAKRLIRTETGRDMLAHGIALPLLTDRENCKTLVNFSNLARLFADPSLANHVQSMQELSAVVWLDLGNGVPVDAA